MSRPIPAPSRPSPYRSGLPARLLAAGAVAALVWLVIGWALVP